MTEQSKIPEIPTPYGSSSGVPRRAFTWNRNTPIQQTVGEFLEIFLNTWHFTSASRRFEFKTNVNQEYEVNAICENLLRVLHTILTENPDRYVEITKEIRKVIPDFSRITMPLNGNQITGRISEPGNVVIEVEDISSGSHQVLMLISSIMTSSRDSLIMLEEPEQSLHAHAQRALFNLIKILSEDENKQFVITTHSTVFTKLSDHIHTYLVHKDHGSSGIRKLEEQPSLIVVKHDLGHENTDLFLYNGVTIVEGDTEEKAIPLFANSMGIDFIEAGIRVINIGGTGNTTRIKELMEFLKDTDVPTFFIIDEHSTAQETLREYVTMGIIKDENIFWVDKGFEDSFTDSILTRSLNKLAKDSSLTIVFGEDEISSLRKENKPIFKTIQKLFYDKTRSDLRKSDYGLAIAETILSTDPEYVKSIAYGKFIQEIYNRVKQIQ